MSVVMDGRDIGTTILPDADVKIYLTASSLTRAKRRYLELQEKGTVCNLDEIQKDIEERDQRDMNREISPLRQAEDAVLVDSSRSYNSAGRRPYSSDLQIQNIRRKIS